MPSADVNGVQMVPRSFVVPGERSTQLVYGQSPIEQLISANYNACYDDSL